MADSDIEALTEALHDETFESRGLLHSPAVVDVARLDDLARLISSTS